MKVINPIDDILDNKNKVKLLRYMVMHPSGVATGRRLAKELGMNHATCMNALNSLHEAGIVDRKRVGSATVYEVARDTVVYKDLLKPLFKKEAGLLREATKILTRGLDEKVLGAFLFGSVAKGEETPGSDTDILLVVKDDVDKEEANEKLNENALEASKVFHTGFDVILYTKGEFERRKKRGHPFVKEALSHAVPLKMETHIG